jgi:multiple sugar transport system substrate-binding protein
MAMSSHIQQRLSRRRLLRGSCLLAGSGVLSVLACRPAAPGQATWQPARAPVEIVFSTWYRVVTEPLIPLFEKFEEQTRIKVRLEWNDRNMAQFTAWFVSGSAPDVINGDNFSWSQFYNAGYILDLADYLKRDKIDLRKQYVLMGSEIWCDKYYAMPFDADPRAVYYNKSMLKQAGAPDPWDDLKGQWTFDDMLRIAQLCTKDTDGDGKVDQWGIHMSYTGMSEVMGMFVWSFGGTWADFQNMRYTLDSRESIEAHQYVFEWVTGKKVVVTPEEQRALGGNPFTLGKAAMWVRAAASQGEIKRTAGDRFEWDIAPWPGRQRGTPGITLTSGNPHTVTASTKYPEESYQFAKFLAGPDVQGFWAKEKLQLPTLKQFQEEFVKDPQRHVHVFADVYKVPYGIHFRHDHTVRHYREYSEAMSEVYALRQPLVDTLREFNRRASSEVTYGACLPYKGMTVPIRP